MNKLFSKVATLSVGLAMAIGVGVAVGSKGARVAKADAPSVTLTASTVNDFDTSPWSITEKPSSVESTNLSRGWQWGSGKSTVITYASSKAYSKVVVTASTNGSSSSIDVSVGGVSFGSNSITSGTAAKNTPYEFTGSGTGNVVITVNNTSSKTTWILQLDLYEGTSDPLESITVSGSMTKTSYTTAESWSPAGLVATGHYESGADKDVTSSVTWSYNPAAPAVSVTSVVATASIGTVSGSSSSQAVTVTEAPANPGTEDNPYTVAQARAAIDAGSGTSNVYATGIVSEIVTVYSSKYLNVTFNFSDDGTATSPQLQAFREKSSYSSTVKKGDIVVVSGTLMKYGSTYEFGANCAISSLTEPTGTKYSVTGNINHGELNVSEILEKTALSVNVVPEVGYYYPETLSSVKVGGVDVAYSYENGVVSIAADKITGNVTISGTCVACNPLRSIYAIPAGYSTGTVYGYYVGYLGGSGPIIMNGEYGVLLYGISEEAVSAYTAGESILAVSGLVDHYNGLGQIKSASISAASGEYPAPATPVVYAAAGGETTDYANRLTTVTGVPAIASGSKGDFSSAAGTNDITMNFTVGSNNIQVFYKKAAQTADADAYAAAKAAVEGSSEITIKGFTSWYNGFQVQMNGYVAPAEGYTAEDFAQDLLDQTDAVCAGWKEGDNNHDALEVIWSDLASNDKYPSLPSEQKTILAEAARDEEGTIIEQAMARYDFLTGKYSLSNFINGRTPIVSSEMMNYGELDLANNSTIVIVISIATVSALAFTLLLVFKKKKHN